MPNGLMLGHEVFMPLDVKTGSPVQKDCYNEILIGRIEGKSGECL